MRTALNVTWRAMPWVSFLLFLASGVLFFTQENNWIVTTLMSIYVLVLHQVLPKTGW